MNNFENLIKELSNLTDEQKEAVLNALTPSHVEEPKVEIINDEDFGEVRKVKIADILATKAPAKKVDSKYGVTQQIGRDGKPFGYQRKEFDGFETSLDEVHEDMKKAFIDFSKMLIKAIDGFCGAGDVAITMYEPYSKYANKDGKVFYRWDNATKTQDKMDELWPQVEAFVKAFEEAKAKAGDGE